MSRLGRKLIRAAKEANNQKVTLMDKIKDSVLGFFEDLYWKCIERPMRRLHIMYRYAKQGYHTNNFDYYYLIQDMQFKLRLMAEYIHKHGHNADAEQIVKSLLKFKVMLKDLYDSDKLSELEEKHLKTNDEKYGEVEIKRDADGFWVMNRAKIQNNPQLEKQFAEDMKKQRILEHYKRKRIEKRVLQYFQDMYREWWD